MAKSTAPELPASPEPTPPAERPATGGSFIRNPDGSLSPSEPPTAPAGYIEKKGN